MYIDKRGFHCVTHRFTAPNTQPGEGTEQGPFDNRFDGGHAFSLNGYDEGWAGGAPQSSWFCADGAGGHVLCNYSYVALFCRSSAIDMFPSVTAAIDMSSSRSSPVAYNSTIIYKDGVVRVYGTRERPHVQFDDAGNLVSLTNSVSHCMPSTVPDTCGLSTPTVPGCNHSNAFCPNHWTRVGGKPLAGYRDRSFTSVTPLRTKKPLKSDDRPLPARQYQYDLPPPPPAIFTVTFATDVCLSHNCGAECCRGERGEIPVRVNSSWAPLGADRFYAAVNAGFYNDSAFFRVVAKNSAGCQPTCGGVVQVTMMMLVLLRVLVLVLTLSLFAVRHLRQNGDEQKVAARAYQRRPGHTAQRGGSDQLRRRLSEHADDRAGVRAG